MAEVFPHLLMTEDFLYALCWTTSFCFDALHMKPMCGNFPDLCK